MKNLMTDSIKLIEDGLTSLIERINNFEFTSKNEHSKEELNRIIKCIEELPIHTEEELNDFVTELNQIPQHTEDELIAFIENLKETPRKSGNQLLDEIKALKCQPKSSVRGRSNLNLHLKSFPEHTEGELNTLLEYIKIFPVKMEEEINLTIRNFQRLPVHSQEDTDTLFIYLESKGVSQKTKKGIIDFIKRITLIRYLNFSEKIKHLEKESKEQLVVLTNIIRKYIPSCSMIVLFGSYARGTEVIYDEYIDKHGSRLSYQSDFDIMVVLPSPATVTNALQVEGRTCSKIKDEYNKKFLGRLHAPPQFVIECENALCKNLEIHQPFFSDIIKEGILLYTDGLIYLTEPKELLYKIKKEIAQKHFERLDYVDRFYSNAIGDLNDGKYGMGAFNAHQACENYYRIISMVFINYKPKLHDLAELIERTKSFSIELLTVFPRVTVFEKRAFKLLRDAYIDARYDLDFVVTKEELEYMLERAEALKEIAYRICPERIEYYDKKSKEELDVTNES